MPKILLSSTITEHVFDIDFVIDEGGTKRNNREFPEDEQVRAKITTPTAQEKANYLYAETKGSGRKATTEYKTRMSACVRAHCKEITGMEAHGIIDGETLLKHPPSRETNEMIQDIYYVAMGLYREKDSDDDTDEEEI